MKKTLFFCLLVPFITFSQDDLLSELEGDVVEDTTVESAFKGLKVVNFETTKLVSKKDFYLIISHRFGTVKNGIEDLFGLDESLTQIKFIYGINDWLNLGVARSSLNQKYGLHAKYRLVHQKSDGSPVAVVGYNLVTMNNSLNDDVYPNLDFGHKFTYTSQVLVSRKFSEKFSFLLAPTYIHENLATRSFDGADTYDEDNDQFAVGLGGRYKISKRVSINLDYGLHLNRNSNSNFRDPLSVGVDIETGGHVFQVHFSNAQAMFEEGYIINATGDWGSTDFFFGFNLSRVF
ncbi:MAG: hypothetical protein ACI9SJ_000917 [Flavobacteriaceae bacterium]|jgi:hypothetical protein|uniref:DUF5777 family beta-barrel protein n=1 Tax=Candidatus Marifrigoribacter sp. Uisw_064 TaxID=3230970 RepID=UPI003AE93453